MSNADWDELYSRKGTAKYPETQLIRFVSKYYYNVPNRKDIKFLDVGCGGGSNTWFLVREGFSVAAIDSSSVAMEKLRLRLKDENLEAFLGCGDITKLEFKPDFFDCVVDISSLCYLPKDKIEAMMKSLHTVLKPNGRIFSITPTDTCSKSVFNETAPARFQTHDEAMKNFRGFKDVSISEYKYVIDRGNISLWCLDAVKK